VALIVDAGAMFAQADADEPRHRDVVALLQAERETLVTTELAVAEADYLILDRLGVDVELAFIEDIEKGTFVVDCLNSDELRTARSVIERHRDLRLRHHQDRHLRRACFPDGCAASGRRVHRTSRRSRLIARAGRPRIVGSEHQTGRL
jgi:predicted nucleic acid-binding protein